MQSCKVDVQGLITDATAFTDLTAESYRCAAQIYVHCRLLRKPRRHPDVQSALKILLRCIEITPKTGTLYTAQASLFGPLIAGCVAVTDRDRGIVRGYFKLVVEGPRGNVPPVWRAMQDLWLWLDEEFVEDAVDDNLPLFQRRAWWESMVARVMDGEGRLSLT